MTSLHLPADAPTGQRSASNRPRLRRPSGRAGVTWMVALVVIGVLLAIQVGRQVYANYSITQEAGDLRAKIAAMQAANFDLRRQLDYLRSDAYITAEARRLANLGRAGEQLLIIPPGSEARIPPALLSETAPDKPLLEQWVDLFFGG